MHRNTLKKLALAVAAPLFMTGITSAATLYSETTPLTGSFYAPQGNTAAPSTTVQLDNIVVPSYPAPGAGGLNVTKVTINARQTTGAPATTVQLYYSTIATDRTNVADPIINAPTSVGAPVAVAANPGAATNTPVVFGNGVSTLFSLTDAQLNFTDPGVTTGAEFLLGFKFSDTGTTQGLLLAKPDAGYQNPVEYYEYNTATNGQQTFTFFAQNSPNDGAGFYITVEGNLVPEPATMGFAAIGGLMLLARRPGRQS